MPKNLKNTKKNKYIIETIFGFFLLGKSIFLFLSFFSFLFHWKNDQSQIYNLFDKDIVAENILGKIGAKISHFFIHCGIGISAFFLPLLFFFSGLRILFGFQELLYKSITYKFFFFSIWLPITFYLIAPDYGILSGVFGFEIGNFLINLFGKVGVGILVTTSILLYSIIIFRISTPELKNGIQHTFNFNVVSTIFFNIKNFLIKKKIKNAKIQIHNSKFFSFKKKKKKNDIHEILSYKDKNECSSLENRIRMENQKDLENNKKKIVQVLNYYKIDVCKIKTTIGPTITLYEIFPKVGVRISKIKNLENEIALNLSALRIRIIAPIPGKGSIGIEVPNNKCFPIYMKNILFSEESFKKSQDMELPISLGKTVYNEVFIIDLAKMPHLLIAGSTGQGKSVGLNAIIIFLLYKKNPEEIKFVLIDPKKVELSIYKKISQSYFAILPNSSNLDPIITNIHEIKNVLNSLCKEMDKRYAILEKKMVRNIQEYNEKHEKKYHLPYIILIIDEFADLSLSFKKKEIEKYITRLAQLARAVGIHLILSTQRPSVDVITGLIKSNFTARVAFRVSSKIDSRTILDCTGAEQLIGKGDLLFSNRNELIRLQCPFIDIYEIQKIVDFYGKKNVKKNEYFFLPKPD
ncbi:FtsK/SpoIIIE family DNA translocase [Blattabacterium cuenoti]|uniref:FtsK/SpoIIIE family DNA translocase n=1 Tax=Blattabacterium cuenoti TaxID=1653831 RepID=UPI00163D0E2A|nr:DNA translocase FtsK [Blattabacterium cuenoti]